MIEILLRQIKKDENKKGEGRSPFTFLQREISPVTTISRNLLFYDRNKVKNIFIKYHQSQRFFIHIPLQYQICSFAFFSMSCSTVSWYISSGTQQSTGHTAAHCGSS